MHPTHGGDAAVERANSLKASAAAAVLGAPQKYAGVVNGHHENGNGVRQNGGNALAYNNSNGNGLLPASANGGRRDSTQMWTPLLPNGAYDSGSNGSNGSNGSGGGGGGANTHAAVGDGSAVASNGSATPTVTLYAGVAPSNNNEWKDAEEINNLKNGLLHHAKHHNHQHQPGTNNNGSLLTNGKNGLVSLADKYDEQDPLTGLYKQQKHHACRPSESDESDFDSSDLSGSGGGGAGGGSGGERGGKATASGCGLFGCRPRWARHLASTNCFMVVFLLAYILQGMYMTYFVSVITTIEKLFQIKSKTTGFLLSASEMGQISTAMLLTYFAGRGHRPRWIACGMVLFSVAAFSCSLPHFIFGEELMRSAALLNSPPGSSLDAMNAPGRLLQASYNPAALGADLAALNGSETSVWLEAAMPRNVNLCSTGNNLTAAGVECDEDRKLEQASHSKITVIVLFIFFASLLSSGIGQTAVATLGIPYIDDNVASKQSPMYMAITIGVRILGPASGFIVGSFCTRWYVSLGNPGFDASDPRWIGAWWLGPVVIGSLMMLASIAMFSFPRQLRGKRKPPPPANDGAAAAANVVAEPEEKPKLRDFPKTVRRQLSNDILMFRTASCVFHLLPIAGLYTFLPKYLETQFRLATYDANMVAAFCGILVMGVGIVISGLVILKLKPSARSVAAWIAFTALFYSAGMFVLMFIGCSMNDFAGFKAGTSGMPAVIEPACSAALNCTCDRENFAPICGIDDKIYISACHAGCSAAERHHGANRMVYSNCACIPESFELEKYGEQSFEATSGYCGSNCNNIILFILIFAVCVFMHSTSEVGSMLLVMRCTHPKDKCLAMGVIQSAIGLFGNVPCPIIYGAVVDSACLIWKTVCGKHGACSLYNADTFRHYFLGITSGIMFLAFIMDIVVWSKAHRIDITPEDTANGDGSAPAKSTGAECKKSLATTATDTSV